MCVVCGVGKGSMFNVCGGGVCVWCGEGSMFNVCGGGVVVWGRGVCLMCVVVECA